METPLLAIWSVPLHGAAHPGFSKSLKLFKFYPDRNWRDSLNRPRATTFGVRVTILDLTGATSSPKHAHPSSALKQAYVAQLRAMTGGWVRNNAQFAGRLKAQRIEATDGKPCAVS